MKAKLHTLLFSAVLMMACIWPGGKLIAQNTVTIPDTAFVSWLSANGYSSCLTGNQLDTTCTAVTSAIAIHCNARPIRDLTGIQYFKHLDTLECSNDSLILLPAVPASLQQLSCQNNNLISLPTFGSNLTSLACYSNKLISLPTLPPILVVLDCSSNYLTNLPLLPASLVSLRCQGNIGISSLPVLPANLIFLVCTSDHLISLGTLPSHLIVLYCDNNQLTSLPTLPAGLQNLWCGYNLLDSLPSLPASLQMLFCQNNNLVRLPVLDPSLQTLRCDYNHLSSLPALPLSLTALNCSFNNISSLPLLPPSMTELYVTDNLLTSIPQLPNNISFFHCYNNTNLVCLPELKQIYDLRFYNTGVTCLSDYGNVYYSVPDLNTIPLCGIFNPTGCTVFWDISGTAYYDANNNCQLDANDVGQNDVKLKLYSGGSLVQQVFSGGTGNYSFNAPNGNYTLEVDTSNLPFILSCPAAGYLNDTITTTDSLSYGNNFAFKCRSVGFDIGVQSILNNYVVPRPNSIFTLNTIAGDISQLYGAHCAAGISGKVQLIFNGPVTYIGPAAGAVAPTSVSIDTITWSVADFGTVNDMSTFNLVFQVNSNAVAGSSLCFTVVVTPVTGDYNPGNNTLTYCFPVVNALDPNEKEVYPTDTVKTSDWLTYTIRFQNTGTAPAVNIIVTDTLDSNLDASTIQLLAYSAKNLTQVFGNVVVFNFPNINLPDSATSDSLSRGYVQFKVKLKDNLSVGTQVNNTANIYFDLNPAVVTNTVTNTIGHIATANAPLAANDKLEITLMPNPAHDYVMVLTGENTTGGQLQLSDIEGRQILSATLTGSNYRIETGHLSAGVYLVKVSDMSGRMGVRKLVLE